MPRTRIKICGLTQPASARAAVAAGADAIGLVFVEESPRQVNIAEARAVMAELPALVEPVGLFVDAPMATVRDVAAKLHLSTVQLHGDESWDDVASLAPLRVIKATNLAAAHRLKELAGGDWRQRCSNLAALLWDAPRRRGDDGLPGGRGETFDWEALVKLQQRGALDNLPPMILSGGLTPANVGAAIAALHPYGVDVSSGVETSPGVKDVTLIHAFAQAVMVAEGHAD